MMVKRQKGTGSFHFSLFLSPVPGGLLLKRKLLALVPVNGCRSNRAKQRQTEHKKILEKKCRRKPFDGKYADHATKLLDLCPRQHIFQEKTTITNTIANYKNGNGSQILVTYEIFLFTTKLLES